VPLGPQIRTPNTHRPTLQADADVTFWTM